MNWKPEVFVDGGWCGNALVFATEHEAERSGYSLLCRWLKCESFRAVETEDAVNYHIVDNQEEVLNGHS